MCIGPQGQALSQRLQSNVQAGGGSLTSGQQQFLFPQRQQQQVPAPQQQAPVQNIRPRGRGGSLLGGR